MDARTFEQGYQELEGVSGGWMLMDLGRAAKLIEEANRDAHGKDHKKDHHH
jgi:hypothetical protein